MTTWETAEFMRFASSVGVTWSMPEAAGGAGCGGVRAAAYVVYERLDDFRVTAGSWVGEGGGGATGVQVRGETAGRVSPLAALGALGQPAKDAVCSPEQFAHFGGTFFLELFLEVHAAVAWPFAQKAQTHAAWQ